MPKIKTSDLTGAALDGAVAKCEGVDYETRDTYDGIGTLYEATVYSTSWAQGGPIIEREKINLEMQRENLWVAQKFAEPYYRRVTYTGVSDKPLIAAMRCYVASKLGDDVEIPEEISHV